MTSPGQTTRSAPVESPVEREAPEPALSPPRYHLVLLDDDHHTYAYVIEMLGRIFGHGKEKAFALARIVDTQGTGDRGDRRSRAGDPQPDEDPRLRPRPADPGLQGLDVGGRRAGGLTGAAMAIEPETVVRAPVEGSLNLARLRIDEQRAGELFDLTLPGLGQVVVAAQSEVIAGVEEVVADAMHDHPALSLAVKPLGDHDLVVHRELALHLHRPRPHRQPEARGDAAAATRPRSPSRRRISAPRRCARFMAPRASVGGARP